MTPTTRIWTYDTTLRDGSQGEGVDFSLMDKLSIAQRLDEIGIDYIEGGYPLSNPKDAEFFRAVRDLDIKRARICAFGMTRRRGIVASDDIGMKALVNARPDAITVVGKSWDMQATEVLGVDLDENLKMISDSVAYLASEVGEIVYDAEHFFDGWKANPDYALRTISAAAQAGARWVVLCDTNGGTLPEEVARAVQEAQAAIGCSIGIHTHNDCELAVANSLAAIRAGATQVQGTINGIGERCGNADLISVIANLSLKYKGYELLAPGSIEHLTELSRFVYETANLNLRNGQPFVGSSAFAHKGGMHVHGVRKNTAAYEHIDPALVGNERRVLVSELSGRSNLSEKLEEYGIEHDQKLVAAILDKVVELENEGYQFEAADASFLLMVEKLAGRYRPPFEPLGFRVSVQHHSGEAGEVTEATIKVRIGDVVEHAVAEGDGPVNALDNALRKALMPHFPNLAEMSLADYKVRVINSRAGTAAKVRVFIESRDAGKVWGTVGVSENVIEASRVALFEAVQYKLLKDSRQARALVTS
ncbi:citramalate synthase [bacterium]|nr:citramalate synthase [bacterium]